MSDDSRQDERRRVSELLGLDEYASQEANETRAPCPLHETCIEAGDDIDIHWEKRTYFCRGKGDTASLRSLIKDLESQRSLVVYTDSDPAPEPDGLPNTSAGQNDGDYSLAIRAANPVLKTQPQVLQLRPEQQLPTPEEIAAEREERLAALRAAQAEKRKGRSERVIIGVLALVFVIAGLSGFANYQAFSATVGDPVQGRIWGWAGVIAAVISFGGFTFVYWHGANRRMKEAFRALVFALIGAGASIIGTEIYIRGNAEAAAAAVETAGTNRAVLESQIADWRRQLGGIPPETRSVEGLEAYLAEVERVGRTEQKPYRDAQNELGLARRRDELTARIEAANAELLGQGSGNILLEAEQRAALPSWLFAALLELFSSQATSIGLVALLLLASGRREPQPGSG
ncbi:hypothetical protein [Hyphomonas sp.]|uniref:hypothetical protein n=1 Tax=Hyphomonas sp. TaxID=87 RepID=UPI00391A2608